MKIFSLTTYYLGFMLLFFGVGALFLRFKFYVLRKILFVEWEIFNFNRASILMTMLFDWISLRFMGLVIFISSIVLFYSATYIAGDKHIVRFIFIVYLFVLSIVFLIIRPNLVRLLLGWDGLGLVSYCLVIYYQNVKSSNAGIITVLSNRVGDVAILLGISWLLNFGGWNFFYLQFIFRNFSTRMLLGLIILAALTKRAQIPFSAWLPAAIAAPTPVSALVHSSTLVTAGVYLLIRFNYLLGLRRILFYLGVLTMFISGLGANYETDLKKIIALSTLRQLGLIIITISMGYSEYSFFHLMTHAMFKSLLFLCAGVFIHSMGDAQDIRIIGGLAVSCPSTSFFFVCSSLALCGAPFLSGFYSKDLILELYFLGGTNLIMLLFVFSATIFTLSYSVRLVYFVFFNNLGARPVLNLGEATGMLVPITGLLVLSIRAGGFIRSLYFPVYFIFLPTIVKLSILLSLSLIFIFLLHFLTLKGVNFLNAVGGLRYFMGSMWFLPALSRIFFIPILKLGEIFIKSVDQGWLELIGGKGAINLFTHVGVNLDAGNLVNLKYYVFIFFMLISFLILMYLGSLNLKCCLEVAETGLTS